MHSFDFRAGLGFEQRVEENIERPTGPNRAQRRAAAKRRRAAAQTAARKGGK